MQNRETVVSLCLENRNRNITAVSTKKNMTDNKKFWKTAKLFLSDRMTSFEKTTLN